MDDRELDARLTAIEEKLNILVYEIPEEKRKKIIKEIQTEREEYYKKK
jgi:hypothetical protein